MLYLPGMEDLRVPKRAVLVEVVLPGGDARGVSIFLGEGAASHEGPERLSDLLNGSSPFIPAQDAGSGLMTFLHRASIALARVATAVEPAEALSKAVARAELRQLLERSGISLPP